MSDWPRAARGTSAGDESLRDELFVLWSAARAEANIAYDAWCDAPGRIAYAVYRAAEDRADAAEVALSDEPRRRCSLAA